MIRATWAVLLCVALIGCDGDGVATGVVRGTEYTLGGTGGVLFDYERMENDLAPFAMIDRIDLERSWLLSESAFRLADIDPTRLLVVKIRPNIGETNAPPGPYMFLERGAGSFALLCPYMAPVGAKPSVDCD